MCCPALLVVFFETYENNPAGASVDNDLCIYFLHLLAHTQSQGDMLVLIIQINKYISA